MDDLQEAYFSIYEENEGATWNKGQKLKDPRAQKVYDQLTNRAKKAVEHQRQGTHGDDHEMEKESEASTAAVKKATRYPGRQGPKTTPSLPESYDEFDEGFKRMNRGKIERQANRLGGDRGDVLRIVADKMDTPAERKYSTSQARKNRAGGAGSEYRKAQELRARDDAKADFKKYGLPESVDLYDVVLDYLLDEGYADTEENAITIMANMSEEWIDGILDEAQIMSVSGPGGLKHMINRNVLKLQNAASRERQERQAKAKSEKESRNAERLDAANKRGIDRATNRSDRTDFIPGSALRANERDEPSTDYRARRRRAKG
jgi:hypothetical protein